MKSLVGLNLEKYGRTKGRRHYFYMKKNWKKFPNAGGGGAKKSQKIPNINLRIFKTQLEGE